MPLPLHSGPLVSLSRLCTRPQRTAEKYLKCTTAKTDREGTVLTAIKTLTFRETTFRRQKYLQNRREPRLEPHKSERGIMTALFFRSQPNQASFSPRHARIISRMQTAATNWQVTVTAISQTKKSFKLSALLLAYFVPCSAEWIRYSVYDKLWWKFDKTTRAHKFRSLCIALPAQSIAIYDTGRCFGTCQRRTSELAVGNFVWESWFKFTINNRICGMCRCVDPKQPSRRLCSLSAGFDFTGYAGDTRQVVYTCTCGKSNVMLPTVVTDAMLEV